MSEKHEQVVESLTEALAAVCAFLGREMPPPPGWRATELRNDDGLSVYQVQAGGGIQSQHVGMWAVNAGPTPREYEYFDMPEDAIQHALTLERLASESRA